MKSRVLHLIGSNCIGGPEKQILHHAVSMQDSPYEIEIGSFHDLDEWPEQNAALHLVGSGRSSIDIDDGVLAAETLTAGITEYLVHDPWRPAPVVGGCYGVPSGPVDRSGTDSRGDILTFTTAPMSQSLTLAGPVSVKLAATADRPSFQELDDAVRATKMPKSA